jgi:N-acetylglucosaminyldiphosphoundecaprenol N-acetyl-beta-D-mannosaminyltransferase
MKTRPSIAILGIPFDNVTTNEALARIEEMIASRKPHYLATANVDFLVQAREDIELRRILFDADLVLCDGTPLLWVSRWLGNPLRERVAGADIVPLLMKLAAEKKYRVFLLGASPESARQAADRLHDAYPDLLLAGSYSPPFNKLIEMDHDEIKRRILAAKPDLLFVSLGCPKQEKWIAMHYRSLGVPVSAGVGATIDFLAGQVRRAPTWMRRSGLEWVYRLAQEPRRLFGRYMKDLWAFGWSIAAQWWTLQFRNTPVQSAGPQTKLFGANQIMPHQIALCPAHLDVSAAQKDLLKIDRIVGAGRHCFLRMAGVKRIDSTGLAYLIGLQKGVRNSGYELVLLAPSPAAQGALKSMRIDEFFASAPDLGTAQYLLQLRARQQSVAVTLRTAAAVSPLVWHGEITAANADRVWDTTRAFIETSRPERELALDLSNVRFIDSSGLGLMVRAKKLARQRGLDLAFRGLQPAVQNVVHIARLEAFLQSRELVSIQTAPKRPPSRQKVLGMQGGEVTASLLQASRATIFPEAVTNSELATSNE